MNSNSPEGDIRHSIYNAIDDSGIDRAYRQYIAAPDTHAGKKVKKRIVTTITEALIAAQKLALDHEIQHVQHASGILGVDFLTTDTRGGRSIQDLTAGHPFATGIASRCITVAVTHNDVGIGASHLNTVRRGDMEKFIVRVMEDKTSFDARKNLSRLEYTLSMTSPSSLKQTASQALAEAIQEFRTLTQGTPLPVEGLHIFGAGMNFLDENMAGEMALSIVNAIKSNPYFNDGKSRGQRNVGVHFLLGTEAGVIWGGPNHAKYPDPVFYSIT